jgi:hypothetical protein
MFQYLNIGTIKNNTGGGSMTKLNYFQVTVDGQEDPVLFYGQSKKHIKLMCEKQGLDWADVEQKIFKELVKECSEKDLFDIRNESKAIWEGMVLLFKPKKAKA